jgi:ATP-dependent RNA helicase HelY
MSSPAQRYAESRRRRSYPTLTAFRSEYPFALDDFQAEACEALEDGYGLLVCAPTGAGKTVVGEFAVRLALSAGQKCFYTTPIKALSNQKYNDLVARHGAAQVGLLTGDNAVNPGAPVVVMTTEVLRNMLYVGSDALVGLGYVVMDEVHYLGDRFRGAVWEEVIIHLPALVRLVSLSATVSNAEEFGDWLVSVRGDTRVVVHEERPVPLWQHMLVGSRMFDLFGADSTAVNEHLARFLAHRGRRFDDGEFGRSRRPPRGWRPPYRPDVIALLDREGLLPAITFVFSRAGCDAAVRQCVQAGLWLTDAAERDEISSLVEQRIPEIPAADLEVLGYWDWLDGLRRGVAAHHAGLIPPFKEAVEDLFVRGLVRAVFATETLALGINMPARTVVLERLTKFNGETHAEVTPGEYTQLTGRAGRRGIDVEGHAVVLWSPEAEPARVAGLASTRTYPLRSSFRPSYNMAVNLVDQMGRAQARQLLEASFAQFQADRSVAGLAKQIRGHESVLADYLQRAQCDLGDLDEYLDLRRELSEREAAISRRSAATRRAAITASLESLAVGDVIRVPRGRRAGLAVVLDPGTRADDDPHPLVLTEARWAGRLSAVEFPVAVSALAHLRVPKHFNHRSPQERRDLAARLRTVPVADTLPQRPADPAADQEVARLREKVRAHPCHRCPDRDTHLRWAERAQRLQREITNLRRRIEGRTNSLGRTFDRICALLDERGYLVADEATAAGRQLARIWSESDLLVAECMRAGIWQRLSPPELAAVVAAVVYEARRDDASTDRLPTGASRDALAATLRIWAELARDEAERGLPPTREPEPGFSMAAFRWAQHETLDRVLAPRDDAEPELSAGDFVRWCKQIVDLLDQISAAPPTGRDADSVAQTARAAAAALRHGVVAQSMQL